MKQREGQRYISQKQLWTKELVEMWYVIQTKTGQEEPMRQRVEKMLPVDSYEDCKILYYILKLPTPHGVLNLEKSIL